MKCPNCGNNMLARNGRFGEFHYCPNQSNCGQKTVQKGSELIQTRVNYNNSIGSSNLYKPVPSNFNDPRRPFDPETDDPFYDDDDGYCGAF